MQQGLFKLCSVNGTASLKRMKRAKRPRLWVPTQEPNVDVLVGSESVSVRSSVASPEFGEFELK